MTTVSPDNSDNTDPTDPTDQPPGDLSGDVRRPARLRCARALFVLSADDGRLWIAFDPNPGAPHDGVMPHLQENDDVTVTGTTDDGGTTGDGGTTTDDGGTTPQGGTTTGTDSAASGEADGAPSGEAA